MSWLELLLVVAIIGFVIYQQIAGQKVRGRRLVVLPAVVTVIGLTGLHGAGHLDHADYLWLTVGAIGSVLIGLALGATTRLGSRDGVLWAQLPLRGPVAVGRADRLARPGHGDRRQDRRVR